MIALSVRAENAKSEFGFRVRYFSTRSELVEAIRNYAPDAETHYDVRYRRVDTPEPNPKEDRSIDVVRFDVQDWDAIAESIHSFPDDMGDWRAKEDLLKRELSEYENLSPEQLKTYTLVSLSGYTRYGTPHALFLGEVRDVDDLPAPGYYCAKCKTLRSRANGLCHGVKHMDGHIRRVPTGFVPDELWDEINE